MGSSSSTEDEEPKLFIRNIADNVRILKHWYNFKDE